MGLSFYSSHMSLASCLPTLPLCHATTDQRSTSTCASPVFAWLRYHRLLYIVYVDSGIPTSSFRDFPSRDKKSIPKTLLLIQCWCKAKWNHPKVPHNSPKSPFLASCFPEVPLPRALLWSRDPEPFHPSWNMPIAEFQTKTGCFIPLKLHWKTTHQPLKAWYSAMEVYCGTRDLPASLAVLCSHTLSSSCLLHSQLCSKTPRKIFKYSALATLRIQIPASNSRSKQSLRIGTLACRTCHKSQSQASLRERVKDEIIPWKQVWVSGWVPLWEIPTLQEVWNTCSHNVWTMC